MELMVCLAAFAAFVAVLAVAATDYSSRAEGFALRTESGTRAGMLSFELNARASDSRLSAFDSADLRGCRLARTGVSCGGVFAPTLAENSGGDRYGFFSSLPA